MKNKNVLCDDWQSPASLRRLVKQFSLREIARKHAVSHNYVRRLLAKCAAPCRPWTDEEVKWRVRETVRQINRGNARGPNKDRWYVSGAEIVSLWKSKLVWMKAWSEKTPCLRRVLALCPRDLRKRTIKYMKNEELSAEQYKSLSQQQNHY